MHDDEGSQGEQAVKRRGYCSFCGKSHKEVGPLVEGRSRVYICYRCALVCMSMLHAERKRLGLSNADIVRDPTSQSDPEKDTQPFGPGKGPETS